MSDERVWINEPGKPWHLATGVVLQRLDCGSCQVELDELPEGWQWRKAWFVGDQVKREGER